MHKLYLVFQWFKGDGMYNKSGIISTTAFVTTFPPKYSELASLRDRLKQEQDLDELILTNYLLLTLEEDELAGESNGSATDT